MESLEKKYIDIEDAIRKVFKRSIEFIRNGIHTNIFYLAGSPGIGKTVICDQVAKEINDSGESLGFLSYSPGLEIIEKFEGVPNFSTRDVSWDNIICPKKGKFDKILTTEWSVPQIIQEINDKAQQHEFVAVFWDDYHLANRDIQSLGFEVFTHYSLHSNPIARNVFFILAGNETGIAGSQLMLSAIRNRTISLYVIPTLEKFISNYAIPNGMHTSIITFLQNPTNLIYFNEEEDSIRPFATPRSWTALSHLIHGEESEGEIDLDIIYAYIQGCVSPECASNFFPHYCVYKEFNIREVYDNNNFTLNHTDSVKLMIYCNMMCAEMFIRYHRGDTENSYNLFCKFLEELYEKHPELFATSINCVLHYSTSKLSGDVIIRRMFTDANVSLKDKIKTVVAKNKLIQQSS